MLSVKFETFKKNHYILLFFTTLIMKIIMYNLYKIIETYQFGTSLEFGIFSYIFDCINCHSKLRLCLFFSLTQFNRFAKHIIFGVSVYVYIFSLSGSEVFGSRLRSLFPRFSIHWFITWKPIR